MPVIAHVIFRCNVYTLGKVGTIIARTGGQKGHGGPPNSFPVRAEASPIRAEKIFTKAVILLDTRARVCYHTRMKFDGAHLRRIRMECKWGLNAFAKRAGITASHLSRIERGIVVPTHATIAKLARAFEVEVMWMYEHTFTASESEAGPKEWK